MRCSKVLTFLPIPMTKSSFHISPKLHLSQIEHEDTRRRYQQGHVPSLSVIQSVLLSICLSCSSFIYFTVGSSLYPCLFVGLGAGVPARHTHVESLSFVHRPPHECTCLHRSRSGVKGASCYWVVRRGGMRMAGFDIFLGDWRGE